MCTEESSINLLIKLSSPKQIKCLLFLLKELFSQIYKAPDFAVLVWIPINQCKGHKLCNICLDWTAIFFNFTANIKRSSAHRTVTVNWRLRLLAGLNHTVFYFLNCRTKTHQEDLQLAENQDSETRRTWATLLSESEQITLWCRYLSLDDGHEKQEGCVNQNSETLPTRTLDTCYIYFP